MERGCSPHPPPQTEQPRVDEGAPGRKGDVVVVPPAPPAPAVLDDIASLPVEVIADPNHELTLRHAMYLVTKLSVPITLSCMSQTSLTLFGVAVAGRFGTTPLGAASLAYSFISATAFSVASGFCGALDTFLTHAYGRDPKSKMYGVHTQRVVICMLLFSFPCAALFAYFDDVMRLLGQDEGVTYYTVVFTRCAMVGLIPMMLVEVAKRYYQSQHLTTPVLVATAAGTLIINPVVVWILTRGDEGGLGFEAIPIGWSAAMIFVFVALVGYMLFTGQYKNNWEGFMDSRALRNWGPMMRLGGLSVSMFLGEWVTFEVNNMAAGLTSPAKLAAFAITTQIVLFFWNVLAGFFNSMPVFVGTCIGAKQPLKAKVFAQAGLLWCLIVSLFQSFIMIAFGPIIGQVFSDDPDVLALLPTIFVAAACFHIGDGLQSCSLGILRGCGMQGCGALFVALSYPIVGMPLGWLMCFYFDWGVSMLWLGPAIGTAVGSVPLSLYTLHRLDWEGLEAHEEPIDPTLLDEDE